MFTVDKFDVSNKTVKWEKDGKKFTSKLEVTQRQLEWIRLIEDLSFMVDLTFKTNFIQMC